VKGNKFVVLAAIVGGGLLLVGLGAAYVLRPTAEASGEITAVPIELNTPEIIVVSDDIAEPEVTEPASSVTLSGAITYEIDQAESEVRFTIDEILRGSPKTVVGISDQIAAQLIVDMENPLDAQVGVIQVNARTLVTDAESRNRAIRNEILDTDEYELIIFAPNEIVGLPESVSVGDSFSFEIVGDLTIRDITQEVRFTTTVDVESVFRLVGLASTTILRADFDLTIPQVPAVAGVSEDVLLEIDFVAIAQ
jgi:polyisoprenoid-binding protein YceI